MANNGTVKLKMTYLGGVFAGQDLCYCKIDIAENAISVRRVAAGVVVHETFIDAPDDVILLKGKLRRYWAKRRLQSRWRLHKTHYGAFMILYYPSRSWLDNTGVCHMWNDGSF